jgi:hypothetical protein
MKSSAMKKVAVGEVKKHEQRMHNVKKMRAGGKTNEEMKRLGRGMAKVANQKSPVRKVPKSGM